MDSTYWHRQPTGQPLFPDLLWSRPENKRARGKLLTIGGNAHSFAAPAEAFAEAAKAGIGTCRVILPDVLAKVVGAIFPEAEFTPSTPSGSFARESLAAMLESASWADGVLLAGDFGNNSETAVLLESFAREYTGQLTLVGDSIDAFKNSVASLINRQQATIVASLAQLQQVSRAAKASAAPTYSMDLINFVKNLHQLSQTIAANLICVHYDKICVAVGGEVSTTDFSRSAANALSRAARGAVWWLQNPGKTFEALTCSALGQVVS